MSTKKQTTQTNTNSYNQQSMNAFNTLQSPLQQNLLQYMKNPLQSGFFNLRLQQSTNAANQLGQQGAAQIANNAIAAGFGGGNLNAFSQAMLAQNARATSANKAQGFIQNLLGQEQLRQNAMSMAGGYKPLQTGSTMNQTETTGGLGTWLPQLVGAGLGAFTGMGALGGFGKMFGGGMGAVSSPFSGGINMAGTSNAIGGMPVIPQYGGY